MSEHISKTQLEVWEIKERLSNEVEDKNLREGIHLLLEKAAQVADDLRKQGKIQLDQIRS